MKRTPIRYEDYTLDDTQQALQEAARQFFTKKCPSTVVRAAEDSGFDRDLWETFDQIGSSLVSEDGDSATLVDLAIVAEEVGRAAAPIPFVSDVVSRRLLAAAKVDPAARPLAFALQPAEPGVPQLVPDAGAAAGIVALVGDTLATYPSDSVQPVPNQGSTPLGWWTPGDERVLVSEGRDAAASHERACHDWKLLTAAALVGLTETALQQAVAFAKDRRTLGVPIGSLQGVAYPLVDVALRVASARHLVWRAAWLADHEPGHRPELGLMAYAYACRTVTEGTSTAAHFHGGIGFTLEADVSLYFLRAKGWSLVAGDPLRALVTAGEMLLEGP